MSPTDHDVFHPAARAVDAVGGVVEWVGAVWVGTECFGVDVEGGKGAADDECVLGKG